jgi:IS30 family transposase
MYKRLTLEKRCQLQILLQGKEHTQKAIAELLKVSSTTISLEIKRNKTGLGYDAHLAHSLAFNRNKQRLIPQVKLTLEMKIIINDCLLNKHYSPEQISGRCKNEHKEMVSHTRIYEYIWQEKLSGGNLYKQLKHQGFCVTGNAKKYKLAKIEGKKMIDTRPVEVDLQSRIGDWEGDTIVGLDRSSSLVTIVERKTDFVKIRYVESKKADLVNQVTTEIFKTIPDTKKFTLTLDNGTEFTGFKELEKQTDLSIYFAHPYHSWERGNNENTNKLIRWYLPKRTDFRNTTKRKIQEIEDELNHRPRKKHNYNTPYELFYDKRTQLITS